MSERDVCANCGKYYEDHEVGTTVCIGSGAEAKWFPKKLADAITVSRSTEVTHPKPVEALIKQDACPLCGSPRLVCCNVDVPFDTQWCRCLSCHKDCKRSELVPWKPVEAEKEPTNWEKSYDRLLGQTSTFIAELRRQIEELKREPKPAPLSEETFEQWWDTQHGDGRYGSATKYSHLAAWNAAKGSR